MVFPLPPLPTPPDSGRSTDVAAASQARMQAMRDSMASSSITSSSPFLATSGPSRLEAGGSGRPDVRFAGEPGSGGGLFAGSDTNDGLLSTRMTSSLVGVKLFSSSDILTLCCGRVANGVRFCTSPIVEGGRCRVMGHNKKVNLCPGSLYVLAPATPQVALSAYSTPHVESGKFSAEKLAQLLMQKQAPEAWFNLFETLASVEFVKDATLDDLKTQVTLSDDLAMVTPRKKARYQTDELLGAGFSPFALDPTSSYNPSVLASYIQEMSEVLSQFIDSYSTLKNHVALDVDLVMSSINRLTNHVGRDTTLISGTPLPSVWSGIAYVNNRVETLEPNLVTMEGAIGIFRSELQKLEAFQSNLRFSPALKELHSIGNALNLEMESLTTQLNPIFQLYRALTGATGYPGGLLEQRLGALESRDSGSGGLHDKVGGAAIEQIINRIATLENRYNSKTVGVGGFSFQSLEDVQAFVLSEIPSNRYGYFYDAVSLLTTIRSNNGPAEDSWTQQHRAAQGGYKNTAEALIAVSFKQDLPGILFGEKQSGKESLFPLPGAPTYAHWNKNDGVSGVKKVIEDSLDLRVEAIMTSAQGLFRDHPRALNLINACLMASATFIRDLLQFADTLYYELITSTKTKEDDAWYLVSTLIRTVFKELRRARVIAEDPSSSLSDTHLCAAYLNGTLHGLQVMKSFTSHGFRHHPSLSPVLNLHVFKTRVPMSMHKELVALVASQQKEISDLKRLVDKSINKRGAPAVGKKGGKNAVAGSDDE